ncbi:MAG: hypothetical protein COA90_05490 [Gammaproteobacteria bacterium]|nr:MAG: hypothetical protein COA90_05490 [Gammaproteobacteria bacterium]
MNTSQCIKEYCITWKLAFTFLLSSALILCSNSSTASPPPHWHANDYIINSFVTIALKNEFSPQTRNIRKWTQAIAYQISDSTLDSKLHQQITQRHLSHLAAITGVNISPIKPNQRPNLTILFSHEDDLERDIQQHFSLTDPQKITQLSQSSVCLAHLTFKPNGSIKNATVIIPVDRARANAKLLSCVVEELSQIMGLPNDSNAVYPSVFNDKSYDDYLSGLDCLLLQLLYHPKIRVGMDKSATVKQLNLIVHDHNFQQLIHHATDLVSQESSLYHLLN